MKVNRKLIFLWSLCITVIAIASVVRYSGSLPKGPISTVAITSAVDSNPPVINQSFYSPSTSVADSVSNSADDSAVSTADGHPDDSDSPIISAKSYLVGNVKTGEVYLEKSSKTVLPVASMSKLITAIEAIDRLSSSTRITITPEEYSVASDTSRIHVGETYTTREILYPLLLDSSNVAAEALASSTNRIKFMDLMSSYAWEIGMPSTYFADPSGLSSQNVSSASDFFVLAKYLYKFRPDILNITKTPEYDVATSTDHDAHRFVSIHPFVKDRDFMGGKTGHTSAAKDTMLTILNVNGQPVAIVVLSSDDRKKDTLLLLNSIKEKLKN